MGHDQFGKEGAGGDFTVHVNSILRPLINPKYSRWGRYDQGITGYFLLSSMMMFLNMSNDLSNFSLSSSWFFLSSSGVVMEK